jgi:hypothetical protein
MSGAVFCSLTKIFRKVNHTGCINVLDCISKFKNNVFEKMWKNFFYENFIKPLKVRLTYT